MNTKLYALPLALSALGLGTNWSSSPAAVELGNTAQDDLCRDQSSHDRGWFCEVREFRFSPGDIRGVDAAPNGGIHVQGWDRNEVLVRARVQAHAWSDEEAMDLVSEVQIETSRSMLESDGPRTGRNESWSVSYWVSMPRNSDLEMSTTNGGISIDDVTGNLGFHTTNGGVTLRNVGGDVRGRTTNGSVRVELSGSEWDGRGLDVQTTNGSVRMLIPDGYNAELVSGTTNGGMTIDFPITVSGRIDRRIRTDLGRGGPTIRAVTTNGGVVIRRN